VKHLPAVTLETTCGKNVFKLYKIHKKSKNQETCLGVILSHVETMIKNWEGLEQVAMLDV